MGRDSEGGTPEVLKGTASELEKAGLAGRRGVAQLHLEHGHRVAAALGTGLLPFVKLEAVIFALVSWPANEAPECTSVINSVAVGWLMF